MKQNILNLVILFAIFFNCKNEPVINPLEYNSNLSVQQNLVNGVSVIDILNKLAFWVTKEIFFLRELCVTNLISWSSIKIFPLVGSINLGI